MIIKPQTIQTLKQDFFKALFAYTSKISKVVPSGVVNGVAYGVAKLAQKAQKDAALLESTLFLDAATGEALDNIAEREGLPARFGALASSTYVRLTATAGTVYLSATTTFSSDSGIDFTLDADFTVGASGIGYAKVTSTATGVDTNVDPWTIITANTPPVGHNSVVNEFKAFGGQDAEDDDTFRSRLQLSVNVLATGTIDKYLQVLIATNSRVLDIFKAGLNETTGALQLYVVPVNGSDFTVGEFDAMEAALTPYLGMVEQDYGVEFFNIDYNEISITVRAQLSAGAVAADVRKQMQINCQRILDWRYYERGSVIDWEALLVACRDVDGVDRVYDQFFTPQGDIYPSPFQLPRIKGFILYDQDGVLLSDDGDVNAPLYLPNQSDYIAQQTIV